MRIAVVGAGLMGAGIAQVSAAAGHDVILQDVSGPALDRGRDGIAASLGRFAEKGKISPDDATAALERITLTTDLDAVGDVDVVVEAVFEKIAGTDSSTTTCTRLASSADDGSARVAPPGMTTPATSKS